MFDSISLKVVSEFYLSNLSSLANHGLFVDHKKPWQLKSDFQKAHLWFDA